MTRKIRLLFVDDEIRFLKTLSDRLSLRDFDVTSVENAEDALVALENKRFEIGLIDLKMPGIDGDRLLPIIKKMSPEMELIVLTGHGSIDSAVECTKHGAYRYLQKPCDTEQLLEALSGAYQLYLQKRMAVDENKMEAILRNAEGASPLSILRELRMLGDDGES